MKCKIFVGNIMSEIPLETQINIFLKGNHIHLEDVKVVSNQLNVYVFIFYQENEYLKNKKHNNDKKVKEN